MTMNRYHATVDAIEGFLARYISFAEDCYSLPLALWSIGTYLYPDFDAFPYMVITGVTKRSGKTRLSELLGFMAAGTKPLSAMTAATVYNAIEGENLVTLIADEAETLSSEGASVIRAVLNVGYRRGQTIPRLYNGELKQFPTYCPKVFVLIGDITDTLRDRALLVRMQRAEPAERFVMRVAQGYAAEIRKQIEALARDAGPAIVEAFYSHKGLDFLTDRDEELWLPLFAICSIVCPDRLEQLTRNAADMSTSKTQAAVRFNKQGDAEKKAEDLEYGVRLLKDVHTVIVGGGHKQMESKPLLEALHGLAAAPWRKYRGKGLSIRNMADMLDRFEVRPGLLRIGARADNVVKRGYKAADVAAAVQKHAVNGKVSS